MHCGHMRWALPTIWHITISEKNNMQQCLRQSLTQLGVACWVPSISLAIWLAKSILIGGVLGFVGPSTAHGGIILRGLALGFVSTLTLASAANAADMYVGGAKDVPAAWIGSDILATNNQVGIALSLPGTSTIWKRPTA